MILVLVSSMCSDRDTYLVLFAESTSPLEMFVCFSWKSFTWGKKLILQFCDLQILESFLSECTSVFSSIKMHVCAGFWKSVEIMLARTWILFICWKASAAIEYHSKQK